MSLSNLFIMKVNFMLFILASCMGFSQTFNTDKDLLLANFDFKPDEDDIMAAAALASMLKHPDLEEVDYYAVAGAYGIQDKFTYITTATPGFFNTLFGKENKKWTDAHVNWEASIKRVKKKVKKVLDSEGRVFVQEAGQSDFLYDVLQQLLKEGMALTTVQKNVIVVQHSKWNEKHTTVSKLNWVRDHTTYQKINDGNTGGNDPRATACARRGGPASHPGHARARRAREPPRLRELGREPRLPQRSPTT